MNCKNGAAAEGDRDAILANPDAIVIPMSQLKSGQVYVAERAKAIVGFAAILRRADEIDCWIYMRI